MTRIGHPCPPSPLSRIPCQLLILLFLLAAALAGCASLENHPETPALTAAPEPDQPEPQVAEETDQPSSLVAQEDEQTPPEPEQTVTKELAELKRLGNWEEGTHDQPNQPEKVTYDFPVTMNRQVQFYLDFFQKENRRNFARWLARSGRYLPLIQQQLKKAGLPLDLAYLPMIESGYSLTAYSRSRAVGPWQFMRGTARHYGLTVNAYVDERRDPVKSTQAAINYLTNLYEEFGSWHLAVAAYNAGEGTIRRAIRRYKTNNFWEIARHRLLRLETKRYVPKLIAAIIIAKEPEKYGFTDIAYQPPLAYEVVRVPRWTSLRAVALAGKIDFNTLRDLNRHLRRAVTPPSASSYPLRVPVGRKKLVAANLPRVRAVATIRYKTHVVRPGETLTRICRRYNLNKTTLLKANNLRMEQLTLGQRLRIPYQTTRYRLLAKNQPAADKPAGSGLVLHLVRPGETVWELAQRYQVPVRMIAAWNDLDDVSRIKAGQRLALYLDRQSPAGRNTGSVVTASQSREDQDVKTYYHVQGGDTLWSIARRFHTTPEQIMRWNQLDDDVIYPGSQLLLHLAELGF